MTWEFIAGFLQIVIIDLALSADNAIVIGMAAASLPREKRAKAIIIGGACAIFLRIVLTAIVTTLMKFILISAIAGAVLFWVAWKLLKLDTGDENGTNQKPTRTANSFWQAIIIILIADFTMSLDNIMAIAGAARGSYLVLIIGLLISMPLLLATGGFISRLIDKFKWIPFVGAAVISFTGIRMILEDKFINPHLPFTETWTIIMAVVVGLVFTAAIWVINKRSASTHLRKSPEQEKYH